MIAILYPLKMDKNLSEAYSAIYKEGTKYGLTKGTGKPGGAMKDYLDKKAKKLQKEYDNQSKEKKNNPAFQSNKLNPQPVYNSYEPEGEVVDEKKLVHGNYGNFVSGQKVSKKTEKPMTPDQRYKIPEGKMDPVGQEDGDINNDGKKDGTDKYLASRRKAIGKAIAKKRGKVKEGFSAWRIDLDFNEQVKK